jgi:hypothetical protein
MTLYQLQRLHRLKIWRVYLTASFNYAGYTALNGRLTVNEMERIRKETILNFNISLQHLSGGAEKKHEMRPG